MSKYERPNARKVVSGLGDFVIELVEHVRACAHCSNKNHLCERGDHLAHASAHMARYLLQEQAAAVAVAQIEEGT